MAFRFRAARLSFPAGAPFFEEGDVQRHLYLRLLAGRTPRDPREKEEEEEEEEEEAGGSRAEGQCPVRCPWWGCPRPGPFSSLAALEHHYASAHRSACAACRGRPFPSRRLLELHLSERHDPLPAPPQKLPFQCLVEGCPEAFWSPSGRKEHLVAHHRYPKDFRFHQEEEEDSGPKTHSNAKGRRARSTHSNGSAVPMDLEEGLPAAADAMEVGPSGRAEEQQEEEEEEEEVATPQQVLSGGSPASDKRLYRSRVPATICFGQGAPRAFADRRRRKT